MKSPAAHNGQRAAGRRSVSLNVRILWSRLQYRLGPGRASVSRRLRHALGDSYAPQEIERLAKATFAYRAMANHDRAHSTSCFLQLSTDDQFRIRETVDQNPHVAVPRDYFSALLMQELSVPCAVLSAPADNRERFSADFAKLNTGDDSLILVRVVRTGLCSSRLEFHEFPNGPPDEPFLRGALNDALSDNPAQYNWFE